MENISYNDRLNKAIESLETEQAEKLLQLRGEFYTVYEQLKPANLVKGTLNDMLTSPLLIENIVGSALGLATGYFSKKLFIGSSVNRFRKLFGAVLQFGITKAMSSNTSAIHSFGSYVAQHILHRKGNT
jgi:hypothetical protein